MRRLLFVDDEPRILDGLRRLLRKERGEWDMEFALGGPAALDALGAARFDLVITDMRMPEIDGAALLAQVQAAQPAAARFILSGQTDPDATMRAARVAHQFLTKPSSAGMIKNSVNRVFELRSRLTSDRVAELVGSIDRLWSAPASLEKLRALLDRPGASVAEVADVAMRDVAIAAKLLQLVNSSFFGQGRSVDSVAVAVDLLGVTVLRKLVLGADVFLAAPPDRLASQAVAELNEHALAIAEQARRLAPEENARAAYTAGLLHDIGKLALWGFDPEAMAAVHQDSFDREAPTCQADRGIPGFDHHVVGEYLLGLWNLPPPIVSAAGNPDASTLEAMTWE